MKRLFGELDLTWKKIIIFAVIAGLYTAVMAILPITTDTSFADISISFEWWILFGIIIIVNSKTPVDSALKCFLFFLISQPLIFLVQVPFNAYGWGIFRYYPPWFIWTLLTIPMGYIGYYMREEKWWSLLILSPMLVFLGYHYSSFLREAISFFPNHLLSAIFCVTTLIIYPLYIFKEKKLKVAGLVISILIIIASTAMVINVGRTAYNTTVLVSEGSLNVKFDDTYEVSLEDDAFGEVFIVYEKNIDDYMVNARFTKTGETKMILKSPEGEERIFKLDIKRDTYDITEIT